MERSNENVIDWVTGKDKASVTFSQQKYISRVKKLAQNHPGEVKLDENLDGSIYATVPLSWIKISPPRKVSEEQKEAATERLKKMWEEKRSNEKN